MKNILVLTDFSENAKAAEKYALGLAIQMKANLVLYNAYPQQVSYGNQNIVWPHEAPSSAELQSIRNLQSRMSKLSHRLTRLKDHMHRPAISFLCNAGCVTHNLNDVLLEKNIWMIVMGTKGQGFANNLLFGSHVFKVLDKVNCPVLIVPQNAKCKDLKKIVYASDFKSYDVSIIEWLNAFTKPLQTKLLIAHVSSGFLPPEADENLKNLTEKIYQTKVPQTVIESFRYTNISHALHEIEKQMDADMFVLLHRKCGLFEKIFHDGISHKLIKHTTIPVLIFSD